MDIRSSADLSSAWNSWVPCFPEIPNLWIQDGSKYLLCCQRKVYRDGCESANLMKLSCDASQKSYSSSKTWVCSWETLNFCHRHVLPASLYCALGAGCNSILAKPSKQLIDPQFGSISSKPLPVRSPLICCNLSSSLDPIKWNHFYPLTISVGYIQSRFLSYQIEQTPIKDHC